MLHDNDNGTLPTDLAKRKFPEVDGLYVVACKEWDDLGFMYYQNKEWISYPSKFSLDTVAINSKIEFCIGPIQK